MWKNLGWLAMAAVLFAFIFKKKEEGEGPSFEALNQTIAGLESE